MVNAENHIAMAMGIYCVVLADDVDDDSNAAMANVVQEGLRFVVVTIVTMISSISIFINIIITVL